MDTKKTTLAEPIDAFVAADRTAPHRWVRQPFRA